MKNQRFCAFAFVFIFVMGIIPNITSGQQFAGNWEGKLEVRKRILKLVFHISSLGENKYTATIDIPGQKMYNLPASAVSANEQSIEIKSAALGISITGSLNGPKKINSVLELNGTTFPFELKNTGEVTTGKKFKRPQTPAPPFPYTIEEVEYDNREGTMHYGGTLTYPNNPTGGINKYPAVLLITGSGPQDRDETMFDHKPFAILADRLTKAGYAVLRVDDRSMGKTTGKFPSSNTGDFAYDAENSVDFLKNRKEIDTTRLGLLGHSEGALIAAMLASKRKDINFIILMAGPVTDPIELTVEQAADRLLSLGVSEDRIKEFRPLMRDILTAILSAPNNTVALQEATSVFTKWEANQSQKTTRLTTGVTDEKSMQTFIGRLISQFFNTPWYQYFMRMHPADYYKSISCKVLAVYGEKDIQVDPMINSELLRIYLAGRKQEETEITILPGLNHLFQHCKKCTFSEYERIEETLAPEFLTVIEQWLNNKIARVN